MKRIKRNEIRKIVIRMPNWIGDAVMATPIPKSVAYLYPKAKIDVITRPWCADVFKNNPYINEIVIIDEKKSLKNYLKLIRHLKRQNYDLGILIPNSFNSALQFFLGKVKYRIGYNTDKRGFLLTLPVKVPENYKLMHYSKYYLHLLKYLGYNYETEEVKLQLYLSEEEIKKTDKILKDLGIKKDDILIGINPCAAHGPAKRWYPENFAKVADKLIAKYKAKVFIFGSAREKIQSLEVQRSMHFKCYNLAGKTNLRLLAGIIRRLNLFITNDSGPMHIAAAFEIPTVAIFASTNINRSRPLNKNAIIITPEKKLECIPCMEKECPYGHYECLKSISVEKVYKAAEKIIKI